MKYCGNCGNQMQDMDNVCSQCGTPVDRRIQVHHSQGNINKTNNKAVLGMILGIVSFLGFYIPLIPVISSIVGIVLSVMGMKEADNYKGGKGMAIAGLVCGIIALILSAMMTGCYACFGCAICAPSTYDSTWL